MIEMVANRRMDGDEFLQTSHMSETQHRPLSSPKWQVRILGPIIEPASRFLFRRIADDLHRGTIGAQSIGHDDLWIAVSPH